MTKAFFDFFVLFCTNDSKDGVRAFLQNGATVGPFLPACFFDNFSHIQKIVIIRMAIDLFHNVSSSRGICCPRKVF